MVNQFKNYFNDYRDLRGDINVSFDVIKFEGNL